MVGMHRVWRRAVVVGILVLTATALEAAKDDIPDRGKRFRLMPPAAWDRVELSCEEWRYDDPDGWRLADPGTLELLGAACEAYLAATDPALTAAFPCGAIWVP